MIKTTVWPSSWNARRASSTTKCPTCRSGAVGSRPSLIRSLSPRARRVRRWSATWISTARSRRRSKNSALNGERLGDWSGAEVDLRVAGQDRGEEPDDRLAERVDQPDCIERTVDRVAQVLLQRRELGPAERVGGLPELVDDDER